MSKTAAADPHLPLHGRRCSAGLAIAIAGAVLFSTKAIVAKLLYRYQLDAVTVIAFRMMFSLPVFAAVAFWKMRTEAPLSVADRWRLVGLGLVGYYISSFLDFLGLQYISVGLERLILFLTPTFVLLITAVFLKRRISRWEWMALALSYCGIVLVFVHDLGGGKGDAVVGSLFVRRLGRRLFDLPARLGRTGTADRRAAAGVVRDVRLERRLHRPVLHPAPARAAAAAAAGLLDCRW